MDELSEYFQKMFQQNSGLGWTVTFALLALFAVVAYRLTYSKKIDNNGKVKISRKLHPRLERLIALCSSPTRKLKPFTPVQKRFLRIMYSLHEVLFGLVTFAVGMALISIAFMDLINRTPRTFDPVMLTCAILGILAVPIGVLLIYFRDADNPFDEN